MTSFRMLLLLVAGIVAIGIVLSGYDKVHWFLYVPVTLLTFAGVTGICPGLFFLNKLGFKNEPPACGFQGRND